MSVLREYGLALLVAVVAAAIFAQASDFAFVNYDDPRYVIENVRVADGLTRDNVFWALTTFDFSNWHPLTWLSLMLDATAYSSGPHGFHITNIALHALNAALLLIVMSRLTNARWRSLLVAMLFALHPLHVESVAWISERKDVLSTCFGFLAMLGYVRFARTESAESARESNPRRRNVRIAYYSLTVVCFALSLMSKPMLVTLPFVLLLLDWWPLRRITHRGDWIARIVEKVPLLVMSAASSVMTILAQNAGGAMRDLQHVSFAQRLANAVVAYGEYLRQTLWPSDLAVFYPLPTDVGGAWPASTIVISAIGLIAVTVVCVIADRRGYRALLVGWLWYLGTLVPVIGLVQVGAQAHADRYTYVPLIGVFMMMAWSLPAGTPTARRWSAIAATAGCMAFAAVTWFQIGYWRDSATLAMRALSVTSGNFMAHVLMGNALVDEHRYDDAIAHLEEATNINPTLPQAWHNLGFAYAQSGQSEQAIDAYKKAIALRPNAAENYFNLGVLLQSAGRTNEARAAFTSAAALAMNDSDATVSSLRERARERLDALDRPN